MLFKLGISIKMQLQYLKQSLQHIVKKAFEYFTNLKIFNFGLKV